MLHDARTAPTGSYSYIPYSDSRDTGKNFARSKSYISGESRHVLPEVTGTSPDGAA
jgi:hypothetical protein